jgi:chromosome segregation ATPase
LKFDISNNQDKLKAIKEQIEVYGKKIEKITKVIKNKQANYEEIHALKDHLTRLESTKEERARQIQELYENLEDEFTETDQEVKDYSKNFKKQLGTLNESIKTCQDQLVGLKATKVGIIQKSSDVVAKKSGYQQQLKVII